MDNKKQKIAIGVLSGLMLLLGALWIGLRLYGVQATHKVETSQRELVHAKKNYHDNLKQAEHKYIVNYTNANDPVLYDISNQDNDYTILNKTCNQFFKTYWTYNSEKTYDARANKVGYLITDNVKNDKAIFNSDKIRQYSVIDEEGQTATFNNATVYLTNNDKNTIQGIVNVNISVSTNGNGTNNQLRVYQVTYDKHQQKLSGIKELQVSGQDTNLNN